MSEQLEAEPDGRARLGGARDGVRPELDLAAVEPFPDLEIPLAGLDVPLERAVVPEGDLRLPPVFAPRLRAGVADADAGVDAQPERVQDQQQLAPLERRARVVVSLDE